MTSDKTEDKWNVNDSLQPLDEDDLEKVKEKSDSPAKVELIHILLQSGLRVSGLSSLPIYSRTRTRIDEQEVEKIIINAESAQDDLIIRLIGVGVRPSEIPKLRCSDVDFEQNRLSVSGKGGRREVFVSDEILKDIRHELNNHPTAKGDWTSGEPLFIGTRGDQLTDQDIKRKIEKAAMAAGLEEEPTPHELRLSMITSRLKSR